MDINHLFEAQKFKAQSIRSFGIALTVPFGSIMLRLFLESYGLEDLSLLAWLKLLSSVYLAVIGSNIVSHAQKTIEKREYK